MVTLLIRLTLSDPTNIHLPAQLPQALPWHGSFLTCYFVLYNCFFYLTNSHDHFICYVSCPLNFNCRKRGVVYSFYPACLVFILHACILGVTESSSRWSVDEWQVLSYLRAWSTFWSSFHNIHTVHQLITETSGNSLCYAYEVETCAKLWADSITLFNAKTWFFMIVKDLDYEPLAPMRAASVRMQCLSVGPLV